MNGQQISKEESIIFLTKEIARVASAMEKQNKIQRKFFMGIVFGVGTAIGASIIASILVFTFVKTLGIIGFDASILGENPSEVFEQQIKIQTPQE